MRLCVYVTDRYDGYNQQPVILMDEFSGKVPPFVINRLCDPYKPSLQIKGGMVLAAHVAVILISNYKPADLYKDIEPAVRAAVMRRFYVLDLYEIEERERKELSYDDVKTLLHQGFSKAIEQFNVAIEETPVAFRFENGDIIPNEDKLPMRDALDILMPTSTTKGMKPDKMEVDSTPPRAKTQLDFGLREEAPVISQDAFLFVDDQDRIMLSPPMRTPKIKDALESPPSIYIGKKRQSYIPAFLGTIPEIGATPEAASGDDQARKRLKYSPVVAPAPKPPLCRMDCIIENDDI